MVNSSTQLDLFLTRNTRESSRYKIFRVLSLGSFLFYVYCSQLCYIRNAGGGGGGGFVLVQVKGPIMRRCVCMCARHCTSDHLQNERVH